MLQVKKINNIVVKPPQILDKTKDPRPVKGRELLPECYGNTFICSKKKSGKSVTIFNILRHCVGRDTTVIVFCSTLYKDPVYKGIMDMCKKNNINFMGYTSMKDDEGDHLKDLVDVLKEKAEQEYNDNDEEKAVVKSKYLFEEDNDDAKEKKPRKTKYHAADYIVILDDLSNELKSPVLTTLLKNHRHFRMKCIISSQYYLDLLPASRTQLDQVFIFNGITEDKLIAIHKDADLTVSYTQFKHMYDWATKDKYNFFYVDCRNSTFRKNFNIEISIK